MSLPVIFPIKESAREIKKLMRNSIPFIVQRLKLLLVCKQYEATGISKRSLSDAVGVDPNSAHNWRMLYREGGIGALMSHQKKGFKPSVFSEDQQKAIAKKLHTAQNGLSGFVELQQWIEQHFDQTFNYKTVYAYTKRTFGAKIKVARKSHIKKDAEAGELLKKTSAVSVKTSGNKKKKVTKK